MKSKVLIFLDDQIEPLAETVTPVHLMIDTYKLVDGQHQLKIVSKDPVGKEGIRIVPFEVRNGPAIVIEGIKEHDILDGEVSIMVNAYGKGNQKSFLITGSETPQTIPYWVWILVISFIAWGMYYLIRYL